MAINCYDVLKETLVPQPYGPGPASLPKNAFVKRLVKWPFKQAVQDFFSQQAIKDNLLNTYTMQQYPRTIVKRGEKIKNESDVQHLLRECVFKPVNFVCQNVLGLDVVLSSEESTYGVAASQVNCSLWKVVKTEKNDILRSQLLVPVAVKDVFHFYVDGEHLVNLYNCPPKWEKIVRCVSQVFMYMMQEGTFLGVLATDREHLFFLRSQDPHEKSLHVSETISFHDNEPTVREAYTYLSYLAATQYQAKLPIRDVKVSLQEKNWLTNFLGRRKSLLLSELHRPSSAFESHTKSSVLKTNLNFADRPKTAPKVSRYAKFDSIGKSKSTNNRKISEAAQWYDSLTGFSLTFLHLGEVLSKTKNTIIREGSILKTSIVVKIYDFSENDAKLENFFKEVQAYETLFALQGECIPLLVAYGTLFGAMQGCLALSKEGVKLNSFASNKSSISYVHLENCLKKIHKFDICHKNVTLENVLYGSQHNDTSPSYMVVGFGNCILNAAQEEMLREEENLMRLGQDRTTCLSTLLVDFRRSNSEVLAST